MIPRRWLRDRVLVIAAVINTWGGVEAGRASSSNLVETSDTRVRELAPFDSGMAPSSDYLQDESARLRSELGAA